MAYHKFSSMCTAGNSRGVRITFLKEWVNTTFLKEGSGKEVTIAHRKELVETTIAFRLGAEGKIEYGVHRGLPTADSKFRRLVAMGRLFACPLRVKDDPNRLMFEIVRDTVQERIQANKPLRGGRTRPDWQAIVHDLESPMRKRDKPIVQEAPPDKIKTQNEVLKQETSIPREIMIY